MEWIFLVGAGYLVVCMPLAILIGRCIRFGMGNAKQDEEMPHS